MTVSDVVLLEQRRNDLLAVAARCFAEKGFTATTMQVIAREAGMSVGNLYNYFSGKDAIVAELADRQVRMVDEQVQRFAKEKIADDECREQLIAHIKDRMRFQKARVSLEITIESLQNERLAAIVRRYDENLRDALRRAHLASGKSDDNLDTRISVDTAMIEGAVMRAIVQSDLDVDAFVSELVRRMLH